MNPGHLTPTLAPVILNPWFLGSQSLPLLALALTWGILRRRERQANDPTRVKALAANRAIRVQLNAMNGALHDRNAAAFFEAARRALQERLGEQWGMKPESIALSDLEVRLPGDRPLTMQARRIFETAEPWLPNRLQR